MVVTLRTLNTPAISIKDAAVSQKGAVEKYDSSTDIGAPGGNYAVWVASFDDTGFITLQAAGDVFAPRDFSILDDA